MERNEQSEPGSSTELNVRAQRGSVEFPIASLPPEPLTPLLGREREITLALDLIRDESIRLLTITGAGGMGKTRLALRIARVLVNEFSNGAAFVSVATVSDANLVLETIAQTLKIHESRDRTTLERLSNALRTQELLLVIDNFEQVRRAAPVISELLSVCPDIKVLVTSRVPLHISGEQEFGIAALGLPGSIEHLPAELLRYPAVELFDQRARAVKADFRLNESNAAAIASICRRLDGVPLAIELAAARSKVLSPTALYSRLGQSLDLLSGGPLDQPDRLRTLRATVQWSYDLLSPGEQLLLDQLSVFNGGFRLDAAEIVGQTLTLPGQPVQHSESVFNIISALVDNNLLNSTDDGDGEPRFSMLETVREFGLEQLANRQSEALVRTSHARWCAWLAEDAWPDFVHKMNIQQRLEQLEAENDNIRSALAWTLENDQVPLAAVIGTRLCWFWNLRGYLSEGRSWLDRILSSLDSIPDADRALALYGSALLAHAQGDNALLIDELSESLSLFESLRDTAGVTLALGALGSLAMDNGNYAAALEIFERALEHARESQDLPSAALFINNVGLANWALGNTELASTLAKEALALHQQIGNTWGETMSLSFLGMIATGRKQFELAEDFHHRSLFLRMQMGIKKDIAQSIANIASLHTARGNDSVAAILFGAADAIQSAFGQSMKEPERSIYDHAINQSRDRLVQARFRDAWESGSRLSLDEATNAALNPESISPSGQTARSGPVLTPRELDVLRLLVEGRTDREIAAMLFISPRTAQGHVARLFDKLEVSTRTAAVARAIQDDLLISG